MRHYTKADIIISRIHAYNEFKTLLRKLEDGWDVEMNCSLPGAHVLDVEKANRVLQERFWVALYHLPFKVISRAMIKFLALRVTRHGKYCTTPTGISKHYYPHTIVNGRQVEYRKELVCSYGNYVQANTT